MNSPIQVFSIKSQGKIIVFLIVFLAFVSNQSYAQLAGYGFKKKISIDNTKVSGTSDLTDFPMLVSFTDADLRTVANGGSVTSSNGYDIAFTESDGVTVMDLEIEKYVATTGEYIAWIRIPTLSYEL